MIYYFMKHFNKECFCQGVVGIVPSISERKVKSERRWQRRRRRRHVDSKTSLIFQGRKTQEENTTQTKWD